MRSSKIFDPRRSPISPLNGTAYTTKKKEVLEAIHRANQSEEGDMAVRRNDTSVYEFPGDLTYLRYLNGGR
jgi:hypothetical protein